MNRKITKIGIINIRLEIDKKRSICNTEKTIRKLKSRLKIERKLKTISKKSQNKNRKVKQQPLSITYR